MQQANASPAEKQGGGLMGMLGNEGGLLHRFGMGKYAGQPTEGGLLSGGGLSALGNSKFQDFLQQYAQPSGSPQEGDQGQQGPPGQQQAGTQQADLSGLIMQYLQQQQRR
jgi:hypothetical protein